MKLDKEKRQEEFQEFLFYIDDTLDEIKQKAREQGYNLDMNVDSLKDLAQYIRANDVRNDPEDIADFFDSWVYLGEVFRLQAKGAYWTVGVDNPKNINYGLEYLTGYDKTGTEFIPILLVNNFILGKDRLDDNFFINVIDSHLEIQPINLDDLPTEED